MQPRLQQPAVALHGLVLGREREQARLSVSPPWEQGVASMLHCMLDWG